MRAALPTNARFVYLSSARSLKYRSRAATCFTANASSSISRGTDAAPCAVTDPKRGRKTTAWLSESRP
eukprot:7371840-Prymnesium_polylepis.3